MANSPMVELLKKVTHANPDGVQVMIQFKSNPDVVSGALRRGREQAEIDGIYELAGPAAVGDPQRPGQAVSMVASRFFEASAVEQLIVVYPADSKIVTLA